MQGTAGSAKCAAPTVGILRKNSTAFEGTATSVTGDRVTFHVKHWYRGDAGVSTVTLEHIQGLESVTFTAGDRYLVTARDGEVGMCGGTVWAEPQMRDLYRRAFPSER